MIIQGGGIEERQRISTQGLLLISVLLALFAGAFVQP